jgi:hypothetical protein
MSSIQFGRSPTVDNQPMDPSISYMTSNDIDIFKPLSSRITGTFWGVRTQLSTSLDIISVYLKGQKLLYIEAKSYCEWYLNLLMIPAICISAICAILSAATLENGNIIVAGLTGFNSFIISMISYLKLDAKSETFRVTAYKFDKLQTKCEFYAGKILYAPQAENENETVKNIELMKELYDFIQSIEKDIHDIKEVNQFIIPETVRYRFPRLYSINIFAEIKKLKNIEIIYTQELSRIYNELSELINSQIITHSPETFYNRRRLLNDKKQAIIKLIISHRDKYLEIDEDLTQEINKYIRYKKYRVCSRLFGCCREPPFSSFSHNKENRFQIMEEICQTLDRTTKEERTTMDDYMKKMSEMYEVQLDERKEEIEQSKEAYRQSQIKENEVYQLQQENRLKEAKLKSLVYDTQIQKITQSSVGQMSNDISNSTVAVTTNTPLPNVSLVISEQNVPSLVIHNETESNTDSKHDGNTNEDSNLKSDTSL